jgi:phosphatidylglycerol:prolipoprotein diacylglycerol transferase
MLAIEIFLWLLAAASLVSTVIGIRKNQPDLVFNVMLTLLFVAAAATAPIWNPGPTFTINFYGIILMTGAVAGAWLATFEARRRGYNPEIVWDLLIWLIVGGVVGARLWHVFTPTPSSSVDTHYYLTHLLDLVNLRKGGLGIPGAVIGGAIALYFYCRSNKLSFGEWADIGAPSLALGQAIGRWGNFFNQELYGAPTDLPWKIYIDADHRLSGYENVSYYHPLFAYEMLLNLANLFFLLWVSRQYREKLKTGDVFLLYLIVYPTGRFLLDFLRLDKPNFNQPFIAVVAIGAAAALIWRHRPAAALPAPAAAPRKAAAPRAASKPAAEASQKRKKPATRKTTRSTTRKSKS